MAAPTKTKNKRPDQRTREEVPLTIRADVMPATLDEESRTVEVTWSTGAEVLRYDWYTESVYREALSMDPKHIRLDRLNAGAPVLDSHSSYRLGSVLGVVESARVENGVGVAKIRFSKRESVDEIWQDVRAGILRSISVGYRVHKYERKREEGQHELRTAVDWEPMELSIVPIPADAGAQIRAQEEFQARGAESQGANMEETEQEKQERAAREAEAKRKADEAQKRAEEEARAAAERATKQERERVTAIGELCRLHGIDAEQRDAFVGEGRSVQEVKDAILEALAKRTQETRIRPNAPITYGGQQLDAQMKRDATDALLRRAGEKIEGDGFRNFGDGHLVDMARRFLERGGVNTDTLSRMDIATRALATSDFASVLYLVGEKTMRAGYDAVPLVHRQVLRRATASDFRPKNTVAVDAGDLLSEVPEGGQIPEKPMRFEKSQYAIKSYGKLIAFTRKMLIDDDIDALTEASRSRGKAAAETERKLVWDFILAGATTTLAPDGKAVFHADHGNYPSASATPTSTAALDAAYSFFRLAPSLSGIPINASMRYIIASDAAEQELYRTLYGGYAPTSAANAVTERDRRLTILCEPMLGAGTNKKHWMGFADAAQASSFEYAYLAGTSDGVRLEQQAGFEVEGLRLKVCLDFGIGCSDWRGVYYQRQT